LVAGGTGTKALKAEYYQKKLEATEKEIVSRMVSLPVKNNAPPKALPLEKERRRMTG